MGLSPVHDLAMLFSPVRIGALELRNRLVMSPMENQYGTQAGLPSPRTIDYLEARARDAYLGLVERVNEEAKRDVLKQLAAEEQMHYDMLSKALTSMDTPPEERTGM